MCVCVWLDDWMAFCLAVHMLLAVRVESREVPNRSPPNVTQVKAQEVAVNVRRLVLSLWWYAAPSLQVTSG